MALDRYDAAPVPYIRGLAPQAGTNSALIQYLLNEVRRLEATVTQLNTLAPQVATKEPDPPLLGMIRWCKSPWDPLGTGDQLVKYNGSAWVAV